MSVLSWGYGPHSFECFAGAESDITDVHPQPAQLQDRLKDQLEELIKINLASERREAQPVFLSASLSVGLRQALFNLLKEFKDVLHGHMPKCLD